MVVEAQRNKTDKTRLIIQDCLEMSSIPNNTVIAVIGKNEESCVNLFLNLHLGQQLYYDLVFCI